MRRNHNRASSIGGGTRSRPIFNRLLSSRRLIFGSFISLFLILLFILSPSTRQAGIKFAHDASDLAWNTNPLQPILPPTSLSNEFNQIDDEKTHFPLIILISSPKYAISHRKSYRSYLFGLNNTISPCMRQNRDIFYKFIVNKDEILSNPELQRNYQIERLEWDDIIELSTDIKWIPPPNSNHLNGWNELNGLYYSSLKWLKLQRDNIQVNHPQFTYLDQDISVTANFALLTSIYTVPNFSKILNYLGFYGGFNFDLTTEELPFLFWTQSSLETISLYEHNSIIIGIEAVNLLASTTSSKDIIPLLKNSNTGIIYKQDTKKFVSLRNSPELLQDVTQDILLVDNIYLSEDLINVISILGIEKTLLCNTLTRPKKVNTFSSFDSPPMIPPKQLEPSSIAVMTSSYIYPDDCMLYAAYPSMRNKKKYSQTHGYTFISRSKEFAYQPTILGRKSVWGKIDSIQHVLPHFEWILWMDMDTLIVNHNISIQDLIENFGNFLKNDDLEKWKHISLIVSRPVGDSMLNAGVFLIRNTPWSYRFLETVQNHKSSWLKSGYEQFAMAQIITQPEFSKRTLYISPDDRLLGTLSNRYRDGDFIIHYAKAVCPSDETIQGSKKIAMGEQLPLGQIATKDAKRPSQEYEDSAGAIPGLGFKKNIGWIGLENDPRLKQKQKS